MNFTVLATIVDVLHSWGLNDTLAFVLAAIIHGSLLAGIFMVTPLIWIWGERKIAGRIQDRLGPTRVGGRFGWLQTVADGVKLIQKEDLVPPAADSMLYRMAPYLVCIASFATLMVLPFADGWVAVASDIGLFVLVAILSLEVIGIILAGYSSGSKWSLFGGMREAAQMVSYEIPLALCAIIPITVAGSLNLTEITQLQSGWFWNSWLIFHDPFVFITFFVYFTVATASCKRAPFDLAEAESELVGGFHTEYSGMRWSFFFMGEYAAMFVVSVVAAILFLGGWNSGIAPLDNWLLEMRASAASGGFEPMAYLANVIYMGIIVSKGWLLVFVQVWVRWTLPRLRIDQVMITCLKYLIPISCFLFLGVTLWPLVYHGMTGKTSITAPKANKWAKPAVTAPAEETEEAEAASLLPSKEPESSAAVSGGSLRSSPATQAGFETTTMPVTDRKVAGGTR
jgi:NADH-quinone oxidoreductase subunit H